MHCRLQDYGRELPLFLLLPSLKDVGLVSFTLHARRGSGSTPATKLAAEGKERSNMYSAALLRNESFNELATSGPGARRGACRDGALSQRGDAPLGANADRFRMGRVHAYLGNSDEHEPLPVTVYLTASTPHSSAFGGRAGGHRHATRTFSTQVGQCLRSM